MAWGWAFLGGVFGGLTGGPVGAAIGAALGASVDQHEQEFSPEKIAKKEVSSFIRMMAATLWEAARADGKLEKEESELILELCREVTPEILAAYNGPVRMSDLDIESIVSEGQKYSMYSTDAILHARGDQAFRMKLLNLCWRVLARDNDIAQAEVSWVQQLAREMDASEEEIFVSTIPFYRTPQDSKAIEFAAEVLGVTLPCSAEQVNEKFRELSKLYHPDRHPHLDPAIRELCTRKFAEISEARDILLKRKVENLYGISARTNQPIKVEGREIVRCVFCHQKCRLSPPKHHPKARCPKCQTLLLFELDLLNIFRQAVPD